MPSVESPPRARDEKAPQPVRRDSKRPGPKLHKFLDGLDKLLKLEDYSRGDTFRD